MLPGLRSWEIVLRTFVLITATLAALFAGTGMAEAAIRLKPMTCPVAKADAAFRIVGARGEQDGVGSEYQWLAANLPGWRRDSQALLSGKGKYFDLLMVSKGRKHAVLCFDITGSTAG
jgi:hypothetical protein